MEKLQAWSIIIFAYNEEESIAQVIDQGINVLKKISNNDAELIVVNDGSTDSTKEIILSKKNSYPNIIDIHHKKNMGIGHALLSGYNIASCENICAVPADGQFNLEELTPYSVIPDKNIISFYRTQKTRYTLFRKFLSWCNRFLNHHLLKIKIKDVNWIKVYKREFFNEINPVLTSSLVESEICAKMLKNNYDIIEVPSIYKPRQGGKSKGASLKVVFMAVFETGKLYLTLKNAK